MPGRKVVVRQAEFLPGAPMEAQLGVRAETLRLLVVAWIMLVGLLPRWPSPTPYEILET